MQKEAITLWGKTYKSRAAAIRALGLSDYQQLESIEKLAAMGLSKKRALDTFFKPSMTYRRRKYFAQVLVKHGFWKAEE